MRKFIKKGTSVKCIDASDCSMMLTLNKIYITTRDYLEFDGYTGDIRLRVYNDRGRDIGFYAHRFQVLGDYYTIGF
jgi:hypothetical protein